MPMSLSSPAMSKGLKAAATLVGVGVGVTTALNVSTAKYSATYNTSYAQKVAIMLSRMGLGPQLTSQLFNQFPNSAGISPTGANLPQPGVTPFSMLNSSVGGGVVLLVANKLVHYFIGGKYGWSHVSPFLNAIAGGLIGGGLIGGLFDPDPSQGGGSGFLSPQYPQLMQPSQQPAAAMRLQPFLSATGVKLHGR